MLTLEKLENVHRSGDKITARCPACHEDGGDNTGNHLACWPATGKFGCAANPGDKAHRQRIWQLAGNSDTLPRRAPARAKIRRRRRAEAVAASHRDELSAAARDAASHIFSLDWDPADIWHQSPILLDGSEPDWHLLMSVLYPPDAILWLGHTYDSGPGHECHFQTWREWLESFPAAPPRPMTCPDTFAPGTFSRSMANVRTSPYLVVEADEAIGRKPATDSERSENIRRNFCIHRWLREDLEWTLRALIHTGGKSCHAWFDRPPEAHLTELRAIAPALGIDAGVFTAAHSVRLPGIRHEGTGNRSRLLYLAP